MGPQALGFFEKVLRRRISVLMLGVVLLELGLLALFRLPASLLPQHHRSAITVITPYPGADPRTVERRITIPLERVLGDLIGIRHVSSESREGESRIHIFLDPGEAIARKINRASELIQPVSHGFPGEVNRPYIVEYSKDDQPIFAFSLTSQTRDLSELRTFADQVLEPQLLQLDGVAEVPISGGTPREVQVIMDSRLFAARNIAIQDIIRSIGAARVRHQAGLIRGNAWPVNIQASIASFQSLNHLPDKQAQELKYSARIKDAHRKSRSISRTNGRRRVTVYIKKAASASLIGTTERVSEALNTTKLPSDIEYSVTMNRGTSVRNSLEAMIRACIEGTCIAVLVLFWFLRNLRLTLLTALSIPFSVISLFAFLFLLGVGLNAMTFSAIALSAGLLVDNAILISERIWTLCEAKQPDTIQVSGILRRSSIELLGGTGTTIIAFFPLMFLPGATRDRFQDFALTTSGALSISLFFALFILPVLILPPHQNQSRKSKHWRTTQLRGPSLQWLFSGFRGGLLFCFRNARAIACVNVLFFCLVAFLLWWAPSVSGSVTGPESLHARVSLPTGMHLEKTSQVFRRLETMAENQTGVESVDAKIEKHQGDLYISLRQDFLGRSEEIKAQLLREFNSLPDAFAHFAEASRERGYELKIIFLGSDYSAMKPPLRDFAGRIQSMDGVTAVVFHFREPRKYIDFRPDARLCSGDCPTPSNLARILKYNMTGAVIAKLHWENREMDLRLKGGWKPAQGLAALQRFPVSRNRGWTELGGLGRFRESKGEATIWRQNGRRALALTVQMERPVHREVLQSLEQFFRAQVDDPDLAYAVGRDYQKGQKETDGLMLSVGAACLLVYFLLAALLESLRKPLAVLLAVPLPLVVALTLQILIHSTLSQPALFALMILGGLTANGAIVMLSTLSLEFRASGLSDTAGRPSLEQRIINAAQTRVRPILITSMTTVLGMVPLLLTFGSGATLWRPVALVTIAGTLASIPGVLFLTPLFFYLFECSFNSWRQTAR